MVNGAPFGFDSKIDNEDKGSFIPTGEYFTNKVEDI